MGSPLFDTHIVVDWSARSTPSPVKPSKDAIWWCAVRDGQVLEPKYVRTRHEAVACLASCISSELKANRRVLAGFDFPFGFPRGVARHLTESDCGLALWDWFAKKIEDRPDNWNNRFRVATKVNRRYPGCGPFWGRPASWVYECIPTRNRDRTSREGHPPERRIADCRAKGAKTVWQLAYAGAVGSQILLGLPALKRLREQRGIAGRDTVWPLETGLRAPDTSKRPLVLAEVYPSLLKAEIRCSKGTEEVLDRAQVRVNAAAFARLDRQGCLAPLFCGDGNLSREERDRIEKEEAWILGLGHEEALRAACR